MLFSSSSALYCILQKTQVNIIIAIKLFPMDIYSYIPIWEEKNSTRRPHIGPVNFYQKEL